jgi:hypothetical protein
VSERLSVLVLTEDTGGDAHDTICAVAKKILLVLEPGLDERRLSFDRADERARAGMGFNCYTSRSPRDYDKKVRLAQSIATHLLLADLRTAVFVHIDGDRAWSTRDPEHLCANVKRFNEEVRVRVEALLLRHGQTSAIERLALIVPFWSIESWLFHNTAEALRICHEHHPHYESAVPQFAAWSRSPAVLDEQERPKRAVCFHDRYNARLAHGLPAGRLQRLGLSFTETLARADRPGLREALTAVSRHAPREPDL